MSSWYFVKDGERHGPVPRAELDARVADGSVGADTLVWRVGMAAWAPAGRVPELGLPPPVSPPPLPPVFAGPSDADAEARSRDLAAERVRERAAKELAEARAASRPDYAGFWVRLAAKLLDGMILYGIGMLVERVVAAIWFGGVTPLPPENLADWAGWGEWLRFFRITAPVGIAIGIAYSVFFILRHEATPGKRMLGLRVVRADGGRVGAWRVVGRYWAEQLSGILFCVGYVMAAFDEEKRALHDYLCDTRVVKGTREEE